MRGFLVYLISSISLNTSACKTSTNKGYVEESATNIIEGKSASNEKIVATQAQTMWHQNDIYFRSVGYIGAGNEDWAPGYNKMDCYEGQHANGLRWVSGIGFTAQLFCQSDSKNSGKWLISRPQRIYPGRGKIYDRHPVGDWGHGSEKFECPQGSFLAGLAKASDSLDLFAVLCVTSSLSPKYQHNQCRDISTGQLGRNFAQCSAAEYIGGVAYWWSGWGGYLVSQVTHVLCCKY